MDVTQKSSRHIHIVYMQLLTRPRAFFSFAGFASLVKKVLGSLVESRNN